MSEKTSGVEINVSPTKTSFRKSDNPNGQFDKNTAMEQNKTTKPIVEAALVEKNHSDETSEKQNISGTLCKSVESSIISQIHKTVQNSDSKLDKIVASDSKLSEILFLVRDIVSGKCQQEEGNDKRKKSEIVEEIKARITKIEKLVELAQRQSSDNSVETEKVMEELEALQRCVKTMETEQNKLVETMTTKADRSEIIACSEKCKELCTTVSGLQNIMINKNKDWISEKDQIKALLKKVADQADEIGTLESKIQAIEQDVQNINSKVENLAVSIRTQIREQIENSMTKICEMITQTMEMQTQKNMEMIANFFENQKHQAPGSTDTPPVAHVSVAPEDEITVGDTVRPTENDQMNIVDENVGILMDQLEQDIPPVANVPVAPVDDVAIENQMDFNVITENELHEQIERDIPPVANVSIAPEEKVAVGNTAQNIESDPNRSRRKKRGGSGRKRQSGTSRNSEKNSKPEELVNYPDNIRSGPLVRIEPSPPLDAESTTASSGGSLSGEEHHREFSPEIDQIDRGHVMEKVNIEEPSLNKNSSTESVDEDAPPPQKKIKEDPVIKSTGASPQKKKQNKKEKEDKDSRKRKTATSRNGQNHQLQEGDNKEREEFGKRTAFWYFVKKLKHGEMVYQDSPDISEENKTKVRTLIILLEEGKPKPFCMSHPVTLGTKLPGFGGFRACDKYFQKQFYPGNRKYPPKWRYRTGKTPENPDHHIYLTGDTFADITSCGFDILDGGARLREAHVNTMWESPKKNKLPNIRGPKIESEHQQLFEEEQAFYRETIDETFEGLSEAEKEENRYRLPCPKITLTTREEVDSKEFQEALNTAPITNILGVGKVCGIDTELYAIKTILDVGGPDAEGIMDVIHCVTQEPHTNHDPNGRCTFNTEGVLHTLQMKKNEFYEFLEKEKESAIQIYKELAEADSGELLQLVDDYISKTKNQLVPGKEESPLNYTIFGTNIDLLNKVFEKQMKELEKLPWFLQPLRGKGGEPINLLDYVGVDVLGINTVQLYAKPPGVRTAGHMENSLMASINWNIGPGKCIWYAVSYEYWGKMEELIKKKGGKHFNGQTSWPIEKDLLEAKIPFTKFEQGPDEMVYVNTGTYHWVQSEGFCVNVSWNVGQPTFHQLATAMISYDHNIQHGHEQHVPLVDLVWNLAREKQFLDDPDTYKLMRNVMMRSLAYTKWYLDCINHNSKVLQDSTMWDPSQKMYRCKSCKCSIFNIVRFYTNRNDPLDMDPFCSKCQIPKDSKVNHDEKYVQLYSIDELIKVFDEYKMDTSKTSASPTSDINMDETCSSSSPGIDSEQSPSSSTHTMDMDKLSSSSPINMDLEQSSSSSRRAMDMDKPSSSSSYNMNSEQIFSNSSNTVDKPSSSSSSNMYWEQTSSSSSPEPTGTTANETV